MSTSAAARARLDDLVARRMQADATPALALAVTDRGRLLHQAAYGHADLAARLPATPDHRFEIGSIGKTFTSVLVMQLAESGHLDLDAPVTRYLPWFALRSAFAPITLHHLLTHTAGISAGMDASPDARAQVWALRDAEAASPPGARFHYSNLGYKVLGLVLSAVTGRPYPDLLQRRILDPLGMAATDPAITHDTRRHLAVGYAGYYDDRPFQPGHHPLVPAPWLETDTADGSLAATAADLAAFGRLLLNRGAGPDGTLISPESFARMADRAVDAWPPAIGYGYGLAVRTTDGHTVVGHSGGMVGYFADLRTDLDAGLGVAVLASGPASPGLIAQQTLALFRAAAAGQDLPPLAADDPAAVPAAADIVGTYTDPVTGQDLTVVAAADRLALALDLGGTRAALTPWWDEDAFLVDHPAWDRFPLRFARDGGAVVAVDHGGAWFARAGAPVPPAPVPPASWSAYPGHYRSHDPWAPSFRVVLRRGELRLIWPAEPDGFDPDQPLVPIGDPAAARFRVGDDPAGPERLRFGPALDGQALTADVSGAPYTRFFTP